MTAEDPASNNITSPQHSLIAAMMLPEFYPKPPATVTHTETHISHLFFAGDVVYKVKKPVRFSFLDFSSLSNRRHFLQEELRLNGRLAPSVYLAVMPIAFDGVIWRLGGWTEPEEYTLVMRRLPDKRMLRFLLNTEQVSAEMMQELAQVLAEFHKRAERVRGIDPANYLSSVKHEWNENLSDLDRFISRPTHGETIDAIKAAGSEFISRYANIFKRRATDGWIRDVHGDLHAEHICFAPEGIQIFDCIEFSANLRRCDLASEIAFLSMDVTVRGGQSLVSAFLSKYEELLLDPEMALLLPFYECYRALIRAKVYALRDGKWNDQAERYFRFAQRFSWNRFKPFVVMICGFSGTGKSMLACALGERLGLPVYNSDVIRKSLSGITRRHAANFNEGIYAPALTEQTYAEMAAQTEKQVIAGEGAILDATFLRKSLREQITQIAAKHEVPLLIIHCSTSEGLIKKRLAERAAQGTDVSDARWETYLAQKGVYEPILELAPESLLEVNTDGSMKESVERCEPFLRSRLLKRS